MLFETSRRKKEKGRKLKNNDFESEGKIKLNKNTYETEGVMATTNSNKGSSMRA